MRTLQVHVNPKASFDRVEQTGADSFEVHTNVAPEGGKANRQMVKLLAKHLNMSPSKLLVAKGERWNDKTVLVLE